MKRRDLHNWRLIVQRVTRTERRWKHHGIILYEEERGGGAATHVVRVLVRALLVEPEGPVLGGQLLDGSRLHSDAQVFRLPREVLPWWPIRRRGRVQVSVEAQRLSRAGSETGRGRGAALGRALPSGESGGCVSSGGGAEAAVALWEASKH